MLQTDVPANLDTGSAIETFQVVGLGERASIGALRELRAGRHVALRPAGRPATGRSLEVWTLSGEPLGYLLPDDADAIVAMGGTQAVQDAVVKAVIPTRLGPRVHIRIALAQPVAA